MELGILLWDRRSRRLRRGEGAVEDSESESEEDILSKLCVLPIIELLGNKSQCVFAVGTEFIVVKMAHKRLVEGIRNFPVRERLDAVLPKI